MYLPHSIMNSATTCPPGNEDGVAWAREWFLENCCQPAHVVIKDALSNAGFEVRNIQKHEVHDCWEVRMRRGTATLAAQPREAARQVRRVLAEAGVNVERDAISLDQRGDRIHVAFIYDGGQEGFWC